jgi:uncharacterized protein (UPF0261 family)
MATVVLLGTLDTKGHEYAYVREQLTARGVEVLVIDAGVHEPAGLAPDISRFEVARAAGGAIAGMVRSPAVAPELGGRPLLAASMFGVTTPCVTAARQWLQERGFEVLVFHQTGTGGQSMEELARR